MNKPEILARVGETIRAILDQPDTLITMRTTAADVEGWDSFNHMEIVVAVEQRFGIVFDSGELMKLRAVGDFVTLIEKRLSEREPARERSAT